MEEVNAAGFVDPETILRDHPDLGPAILEDLETYVRRKKKLAPNTSGRQEVLESIINEFI